MRIAAEQKKLKDEQDAAAKKLKDDQDAAAKKALAVAHVKQAAAYAQAGAWAKAGEEHRAAATIDGDPQHLLDAADAFHKQPDDVRARESLLAYLEKVPVGETSDKIRIRVAELTRSIEKAEAAAKVEKQRIAAQHTNAAVTKPRPARHLSFGFDLRGGRYGSGSFATQDPSGDPLEVKSKAGPALGIGVFVDFPLLTASHLHVGFRARTFKSGFEQFGNADCVPMCPTQVSGRYAGPAISLEPSVYDHGRSSCTRSSASR